MHQLRSPTMDTPHDEPHPPHIAHLPNGVELAYDTAGSGLPLIFIHGVMGDWRSWDAQWDAFTPHYHCVRYSRRYNHPNHNGSHTSPDHSALVEAQDLRLLLDHLGWRSAVLVGSSYGSFVALALATAHPQRCLALALSEPPMMRYADRSAAGRAAAQAFRANTIAPANAAFAQNNDEQGARIMTGGINGAAAAPLTPGALARRLQNIHAMKMLALSSDEFPLIAPQALAQLDMPVLLLAGRNTPAIHAEIFRNICTVMPQAEAVWLEGAGHATSRDQPEVFNQRVLTFLQQHAQAIAARA
jgi:pimeloyl-ACP methyl ester carboxylesterase